MYCVILVLILNVYMYDTLKPLIVQRCQMEKWRKKYERFCSILVSSSIVYPEVKAKKRNDKI